MPFKPLRTKPYKHPPLENGWTRIELPEIQAETDKALLFKIDGVGKWIPKSQCKVRHGFGLVEGDDPSVIDIKDWFYKQLFPKE